MSLELIAAGSMLLAGTVVDLQVEASGPLQRAELGATTVVLEDIRGEHTAFRVPGDNAERVVVHGVPRFELGSRWLVELVDGDRGLVLRGLGRGLRPLDDLPRWNVNNTSFPPEALPLTWRLVEPGSADLGLEATEAALDGSIAQWNDVGCSSFTFARGENYSRDDVQGGDSWVRWEEEVWDADPAIAGVTGIFFDGNLDPSGATMLFNGVSWDWVPGVGNAYLPSPEVNIDAVVVHEMGHAAGLAHEIDLVAATMFYGYFGGDWQASLAGDDRRGLCELYGTGEDECADDADCEALGDGAFCVDIDGISVCDEPRDGVGADCSVEGINCAEFCVLDRPEDGAGYCSVRCEAGDCPDGFVCGLVEDVYVPVEANVPLCFPFETAGDDDDSGEGDDGDSCSGCDSGSEAALPLLFLLGWRPRRSRSTRRG